VKSRRHPGLEPGPTFLHRWKKSWVPAFAGMTVMLLSPAPAQQPPPAPDYSKPSSWICLPGRADVCSVPLPITPLNANGYGSTVRMAIAKDPPIDCFYVYPTISNDPGFNSDLIVDNAEKSAVQGQFARFASVCRTSAPVYRQMTLAAVAAAAAGADMTQPAKIAYSDVLAAWRMYLGRFNRGRPFVLIGHSQGSLMLIELIKREIEGRPIAKQMLRAYLPGFNVYVPQGKNVGGSFRFTPLCGSQAQTGCVMSWVSFREKNPPPPGAMFGVAPQPGMTVACTNPARPGATGWQPLDSIWNARFGLPVPGGAITWSTAGPPPNSFLRTQGLVSARCVNDGQRGYLSIRVNADPNDKRTDRVYGEVGMLRMFIPGWGMHLADIAVAQGDLIRQLEVLAKK
jgi:hypothetical protein